jgi:hypothetical protein
MNTSSALFYEYNEIIGTKGWWLDNGLKVWESLVINLGCKIREILVET